MSHELPDTNQNAYQLAAIQLTGFTSIPILTPSIILLKLTNFSNAIITLIAGNLILYILRLGILAICGSSRKSTLDIARDYVGRIGGYFVAIILLLVSIAWFVAQTTIASNALTYLIQIQEANVNRFIQTAVALGIISTLLCMEGIKVLRYLSTYALPFLILAFVGVLMTSPHPTVTWSTSNISFSGLALIIGTNLGVTADLPTFFRHSRSSRDSHIALILIQILSLGLSLASLYLFSVINPWVGINENISHGSLLAFFLIILIFLSNICANVANVYSASVAWEIVAPIFAGRKEYLILGLGLTTIFILIANIFSVDLFLSITDGAFMNLCLVMLLAYLIQLLQKRPPGPLEQLIYFLSWALATIVNTFLFLQLLPFPITPLLCALILIFLITTFGYLIKSLIPSLRH